MSNPMRYKVKNTRDPDGLTVNAMLDDVSRAVNTGRYIDQILQTRFAGDIPKFSKWVRENLDRNQQTILRKILVSRSADILREHKIVRLRDAYVALDLTSSVGLDRLTVNN